MLRRPTLPPDNFPDDFDTPEYAHYQPHFSPGIFLWLRFRLPKIAFLIAVVLASIGAMVLGLFLVPEPEPEVIVVVPTLSLDSLPPISGGFPAAATQQVITLPARIDNYLTPGAQQAYRFILQENIPWQISAESWNGVALSLQLYDASGNLLDQATGSASLSLNYTAPAEAQYAAVVTMSTQSDDSYTIRVIPLTP